MEIKKALPEDYEELTLIMRSSKSFWNYDQQQLLNWQDELTVSSEFISKNHVIKLIDRSKSVGFFAYSIHFTNVKLESLFVIPTHIGKGYGKLLMNSFLERAKSLHIKMIFLDADPHSEGFYNLFDFQTVGLKATSIKNRFMPVMVKQIALAEMSEERIFDTDRLFVRKLQQNDLADFHDMQGNPHVMRFIKPPMSLAESRKELNRFISYYDQRDMLLTIWAVIEKASDQFVGICGVYLNEQEEYEIAYRLREKFWGKGIGKEIAPSLIDYCFTILQYEEIVAYVSEPNTGSVKILENLMVYEEEFYSEKYQCIEQKYSLKRKDWLIGKSDE